MNIKVQACGFVLLVILYLLYHQQHTLQTYSQRAFLRFYAVTVLCILMDILSIVAIESASHLPALFVTFVCKTYLITLVLTALCGVMYIGVDISALQQSLPENRAPYPAYHLRHLSFHLSSSDFHIL